MLPETMMLESKRMLTTYTQLVQNYKSNSGFYSATDYTLARGHLTEHIQHTAREKARAQRYISQIAVGNPRTVYLSGLITEMDAIVASAQAALAL